MTPSEEVTTCVSAGRSSSSPKTFAVFHGAESRVCASQLMEQDGQAFLEADLILEVITKNIPSAWTKDYRLAELHLKKASKTSWSN